MRFEICAASSSFLVAVFTFSHLVSGSADDIAKQNVPKTFQKSPHVREHTLDQPKSPINDIPIVHLQKPLARPDKSTNREIFHKIKPEKGLSDYEMYPEGYMYYSDEYYNDYGYGNRPNIENDLDREESYAGDESQVDLRNDKDVSKVEPDEVKELEVGPSRKEPSNVDYGKPIHNIHNVPIQVDGNPPVPPHHQVRLRIFHPQRLQSGNTDLENNKDLSKVEPDEIKELEVDPSRKEPSYIDYGKPIKNIHNVPIQVDENPLRHQLRQRILPPQRGPAKYHYDPRLLNGATTPKVPITSRYHHRKYLPSRDRYDSRLQNRLLHFTRPPLHSFTTSGYEHTKPLPNRESNHYPLHYHGTGLGSYGAPNRYKKKPMSNNKVMNNHDSIKISTEIGTGNNSTESETEIQVPKNNHPKIQAYQNANENLIKADSNQKKCCSQKNISSSQNYTAGNNNSEINIQFENSPKRDNEIAQEVENTLQNIDSNKNKENESEKAVLHLKDTGSAQAKDLQTPNINGEQIEKTLDSPYDPKYKLEHKEKMEKVKKRIEEGKNKKEPEKMKIKEIIQTSEKIKPLSSKQEKVESSGGIKANRDASNSVVIAIASVVMIAVVVGTILGVRYKKLSSSRRRYTDHSQLLGSEEDISVFNRETYRDTVDDHDSYDSWKNVAA